MRDRPETSRPIDYFEPSKLLEACAAKEGMQAGSRPPQLRWPVAVAQRPMALRCAVALAVATALALVALWQALVAPPLGREADVAPPAAPATSEAPAVEAPPHPPVRRFLLPKQLALQSQAQKARELMGILGYSRHFGRLELRTAAKRLGNRRRSRASRAFASFRRSRSRSGG